MNWDMLGHDWAVRHLKEHVIQEQPRHAYLFTGQPGSGRRTLALRFTQALICPQPLAPGEPCRACRACQQIERMQYPDLAVVQAEELGGTLKVDQVRTLQHSLALAPYQSRYRVALLLRFEEAHLSAANALLKTLEEPAPQAVLILTAESAENLLPTIVSRCEVLRLRSLPLDQVSQGLADMWGYLPDQARLLAHVSGGRPGYARRLGEDNALLAQRKDWLDIHTHLLEAGRVERFNYIEKLSKDRQHFKENLRGALTTWLSFWNDVMLRAGGAEIPLINLDYNEEIEKLAAQLSLESSMQVVASLGRALELLQTNVNPRLAAEALMLDLPYR